MSQEKYIHVVVATGSWDQDDLRYRRHRFAEYLKQREETEEVIWVCPTPVRNDQRFRKLPNGIMEFQISDILPPRIFRFGRYLDPFYKNKLNELKIYLNERNTYKHVLWFTFPGFPLLAELTKWNKIVYDCSDLWAAPIGGKQSLIMKWREKSIHSAENRIINESNTIFCTSDFLQETVKKNPFSADKDVHVLENGVEFDNFNESPVTGDYRLTSLPKPVIGFLGGIKPKLDFELVKKLAVTYPDWSIVFIGPDGTNGSEGFKELLKEQNIHWLGKVDPAVVPEYMKAIDIGILPYKESIYNRAVFPLKLFEFLAAGKPVVGMNLPSTVKYQEPGVYIYSDTKDDFISSLADVASEIRNPLLIEKRIEAAKEKDWKNIFNQLYSYGLEDKR